MMRNLALLLGLAVAACTTPAEWPHSAAPVAAINVPAVESGVSVLQGEPRFIVEVIEFAAFNETGWDFLGSDEIIGVFDGPGYRLVTKSYGDVDSPNHYDFAPGNRCVYPAVDPDQILNSNWICEGAGGQAPISLIFALYEDDSDITGFNVTAAGDDIFPPGTASVDEFYESEDQLIGRDRITYSLTELIQMLPNVGDSTMVYLYLLGGCDAAASASPCVRGGSTYPDPTYLLEVKITRLPNVTDVPGIDRDPR